MGRLFLFVLFVLFVAGFPLPAQEKKKDKKVEPQVLLTIPLGSTPGSTAKVTIRGLKLDKAEAVRFEHEQVSVKILSKGSAAVPDKNPEVVGDTQVVVEVQLPKDLPGQPLSFVVGTPEGESKPHSLLIESGLPVIQEKEPNEGFVQSQPITLPVVIDGSIDRPRDVDVSRFEGKAGQKVVFELFASRHGSPLDPYLSLYDAGGQQVAVNDDQKDSKDSRLEVRLPRDGRYFLVLLDGLDTGSPLHVYRLIARVGHD